MGLGGHDLYQVSGITNEIHTEPQHVMVKSQIMKVNKNLMKIFDFKNISIRKD